MKKAFLALGFVALCSVQASAITKYWDKNGTTADSGNLGGTWDATTTQWNTDSTGGAAGALSAWTTNTDTAAFSAGTDGIGALTIAGSATAGGLIIQEGTIEFTGTITMAGNPITVESGAILSTNSSARISTTAGSIYTLNGGTLRTSNPGAAGSFIDIDSDIVLNGGGTIDYTVANVLNIIQTTTSITGTGPLTKDGVGVIAIASTAGTNTYSGGTIVNAGELRMRTVVNTLPVTTDMTVNSPGIFNINGVNTTIGSLTGAGDVGLANGTLTVNGPTSTTFSGAIKDTANAGAGGSTSTGGNVTKNGASQLTLTGANTFTGTLTISSTAGNSVSIGNGGTTGSVTSNIATTTNGAVIFDRSNNFSYNGLVSGAGKVTKESAGIMTINGNDWTNTGGVIINGGQIKFGNSAAGFATTVPVTINDGAALDMNSIGDTFGSLVSDSSNTTGELKLTGNLTLGQTAATQRSYFGTISGDGTLSKNGGTAGTWIQNLNGDNSAYTGNILVNGGRLAVGHNNALGDTTGTTTVASGAELLFQGGVNVTTAEGISVSGVGNTDNGAIAVISNSNATLTGAVTLTGDTQLTVSSTSTVAYTNVNSITGNNFNLTVQGGSGAGGGGTIGGELSLGAGSLTKNEGGTWRLDNATGNSYSGGTFVNAGTLEANNTSGSATGNGDVTVAGGTLLVNGSVSGNVTVASGAVGGSGTIDGNVVSNGIVSPGNSPGVLTIGGDLVLSSGSYKYEIDSTPVATADLMNVAGDLSITSGAVALAASDLGSSLLAMGTKFTLINYGGTWNGGIFTGLPNYDTSLVIGSNRFQIVYNDTTGGSNFGGGSVGDASSFVTITAVPEASTFLTIGLGGIFAIAAVWMSKRMGVNVLKV